MRFDWKKFPLLRAAYQVLETGGPAPIVLNAADEVAVELFLDKKIPFNHISRVVLDALDTIAPASVDALEQVVALHEQVVEQVRRKWELLR